METPPKDDYQFRAELKKGFISEFAADAIAIGSSLVAGVVTAWSVVQRSAYKNLSSLGAFDDMKPKRKKDFDAIETLREKNLISQKEGFKLVDKLVEVNESEAARRMSELGIESFTSKWSILRGHQKVEALAYAFVAGGVALGAILPLARSFEKASDDKMVDPTR